MIIEQNHTQAEAWERLHQLNSVSFAAMVLDIELSTEDNERYIVMYEL